MDRIQPHRHLAAPAYYLGRPRSFYEYHFGRRPHREDADYRSTTFPPAA